MCRRHRVLSIKQVGIHERLHCTTCYYSIILLYHTNYLSFTDIYVLIILHKVSFINVHECPCFMTYSFSLVGALSLNLSNLLSLVKSCSLYIEVSHTGCCCGTLSSSSLLLDSSLEHMLVSCLIYNGSL